MPAVDAEPPDLRQLHRKVAILRADVDHEIKWADDANPILQEHSKIINLHTGQLDQACRDIRDLKANLHEVVAQITQNDDLIKTTVQENDMKLKSCVESNDGKMKEAVESVFANLKRVETRVNRQDEHENDFKQALNKMKAQLDDQGSRIEVTYNLITDLSSREEPPGLME